MGWYTLCPNVLTFVKTTFNDKYDIEQRIEELKRENLIIEKEISMFIYGDLEKIAKAYETTYTGMQQYLDEQLEIYRENTVELFKLEILLDNFDVRFGDFVVNPTLREHLEKWKKEELPNEEDLKQYESNESNG